MFEFQIHDAASSPTQSRAILEAIQDKTGFIPNVFGLIAMAPVALDALVAVNSCFYKSSFTPSECEVIALATSVENRCNYCVAGHSTFALRHGVSPGDVDAIRAGRTAGDERLEALRLFTTVLLRKKGAVSETDIEAFLNAGFKRSQIFELLIGVVAKVMTNFASKLGRIPVDDQFASQLWDPKALEAETVNAA